MQKPPGKSTAREVTEKLVEGGVGMVPVVGSPLAAAFALAMGWSYNRRMDSWLQELAEAVNKLEGRLEDLADDDVFVDAVVNASRAAQATHQQEKLDALRNAVLNSVSPGAPDADEQARFFRLVEQFSAAHLHLLTFLDDAGGMFDKSGRPRPDPMMGSLGGLLEGAIPQFAGRREWYDLLMTDLANARLVLGDANSLHGTMTGGGMYQRRSSGLGRKFLAFIAAGA